MNRLELISQINPIWAITISNFIEDYPEFKQYVYMAPINQIEKIPYKNVSTLFQAIMHYICSAGVRYTYAVKQWEIIYPLINQLRLLALQTIGFALSYSYFVLNLNIFMEFEISVASFGINL